MLWNDSLLLAFPIAVRCRMTLLLAFPVAKLLRAWTLALDLRRFESQLPHFLALIQSCANYLTSVSHNFLFC